jgi:hypothetical protein
MSRVRYHRALSSCSKVQTTRSTVWYVSSSMCGPNILLPLARYDQDTIIVDLSKANYEFADGGRASSHQHQKERKLVLIIARSLTSQWVSVALEYTR